MNNIENIKFFLGDLKASNYNLSFIHDVENLIKENKEWKKYATEEVEEEITELNNKNCELEFKIEHLVQENKELKEEKILNEKILYFANNTICNYQEGYKAGLHKEITATEIVAEERERFIIGQEIKRLKNTIYELHNQLDVGNKRVKEDYIPKSKVKEIVELYDNTLQCTRKYNQDLADILCDLEELLEEGE
ncbi:MAG: hypothetical protein IKF38_04920 [Clostridia bacterium]|nr:hypothetical protein [Clostridia bacterium]